MSILFLEIISIWLLLISFIKNIGNWKKNVFSTFVFCFLGYHFLDNVSKYKDLTVFSSGSPLCTSYDEGSERSRGLLEELPSLTRSSYL